MNKPQITSWGNFPRNVSHANVVCPEWLQEIPDLLKHSQTQNLAVGLTRSYGDSCLNADGGIISMNKLNKFIEADWTQGVITAEAGLSLDELLKVAVPQGWFLPVSPGTKYVTLGGAVANDIHGKNHHKKGTFGNFVKALTLLRSDCLVTRSCSRLENSELFAATIGGLGLTGVITTVTLQLVPIKSAFLDVESIQFKGLDDFFAISSESKDFEYTVAWLDCVSGGSDFARGVFLRGNHSLRSPERKEALSIHKKAKLAVPFNFPSCALSWPTIRAFNEVWYRKQIYKKVTLLQHYDPFFYPLDGVNNWNRIYGARGFTQFQCVINSRQVLHEMLAKIVSVGLASFLAVLKEFGEIESLGMLSFPKKGITLCLDFPVTPKTIPLLKVLEDLTLKDNGRMYPAKDACMSPENFRSFFPYAERLERQRDPKINSSFWRRVYKA